MQFPSQCNSYSTWSGDLTDPCLARRYDAIISCSNIDVFNSSGDRNHGKTIREVVVIKIPVVAVRNPRVVGIVPKTRPEVRGICQYNSVSINDTY